MITNFITLKNASLNLGVSLYMCRALLESDWLDGIETIDGDNTIPNKHLFVSSVSLENFKDLLKRHTSIKVSARYLGLTKSNIHHPLKNDAISSIKILGKRYVLRSSLIEYKMFRDAELEKLKDYMSLDDAARYLGLKSVSGVIYHGLSDIKFEGKRYILIDDLVALKEKRDAKKSRRREERDMNLRWVDEDDLPIPAIAGTEIDEPEPIWEMPDGPWNLKETKINRHWPKQTTEMMMCEGCQSFRQCSIDSRRCHKCHDNFILIDKSIIANREDEPLVGFLISDAMLIPCLQSKRILTHNEWGDVQDKVGSFYNTVSPEMVCEVNKHLTFMRSLETDDDNGKIGFIYLLKAENGLCKIGKTINISNRLQTIRSEFPLEIRVVGFYKSTNYTLEETRILRLTKEYKKGETEWHDFPPAVEERWMEHFHKKGQETISNDTEYQESIAA